MTAPHRRLCLALTAAMALCLTAAAAFAAQTWQTYHNADYGFAIDLPGEIKVQNMVSSGGHPFLGVDAEGEDGTFIALGMSTGEEPPDVRASLKASEDGAMTRVKGTVTKETWVDVQGAQGLRYEANLPNGSIARVLLVGKGAKFYSVTTVSNGDTPSPTDGERAINSFKFE